MQNIHFLSQLLYTILTTSLTMARSMRPRRGQKAVTIPEDDSSATSSGSRQHLQRRAKDKVYAEKLQSGVTRRALVSFFCLCLWYGIRHCNYYLIYTNHI